MVVTSVFTYSRIPLLFRPLGNGRSLRLAGRYLCAYRAMVWRVRVRGTANTGVLTKTDNGLVIVESRTLSVSIGTRAETG
jgi:hypothetical protein